MAHLRLSLIVRDERPSDHDAPAGGLTRQVWTGGRAVGGTLDRDRRGLLEGPTRWCQIADLEDWEGGTGSPAWLLEQINPGDRLSPKGAGALFFVGMDVDPAVEEEFNDWYNTEHVPLLSRVPGVLCARRFRQQVSPRYVAVYHLAGRHVYASEAWCAADQTPWIQRMRRFQRDRQYWMFDPTPQD